MEQKQGDVLRSIAAAARRPVKADARAGGGNKSTRPGVTTLFVGADRKAREKAGAALASELGVKLQRVDLSRVVSKYIGETEKNLQRIFDEAEELGAVLLLDEADALLGKRTEVKDSHDRYANTEVSYLVQRLESYSGIAILATNTKSNIDSAFTRRIRYIVELPND